MYSFHLSILSRKQAEILLNVWPNLRRTLSIAFILLRALQLQISWKEILLLGKAVLGEPVFAFRDFFFPCPDTYMVPISKPIQECFTEMMSDSLSAHFLKPRKCVTISSFQLLSHLLSTILQRFLNSNSIASCCYLECNSVEPKGLNHVALAGVCLHVPHLERIWENGLEWSFICG